MSTNDLQRLAGLFGEVTFTSAEAMRSLDAGLGEHTDVLVFGNQLRAAVGRQVDYNGRTVELQRRGVLHSGVRRWAFVVIASPGPADGSDLL